MTTRRNIIKSAIGAAVAALLPWKRSKATIAEPTFKAYGGWQGIDLAKPETTTFSVMFYPSGTHCEIDYRSVVTYS